jgi:secondary thiamine-phosphate synthase enzyme
METFEIKTAGRSEFVEITDRVQAAVEKAGVRSGCAVVYVPHTTAGLTINEHADPDVISDIQTALDRLVPWDGSYRHSEGNAAAHIKSAMLGHSVTIPVENGRLVLGTWQGIFFAEFDGPRRRKVIVQVSGS